MKEINRVTMHNVSYSYVKKRRAVEGISKDLEQAIEMGIDTASGWILGELEDG